MSGTATFRRSTTQPSKESPVANFSHREGAEGAAVDAVENDLDCLFCLTLYCTIIRDRERNRGIYPDLWIDAVTTCVRQPDLPTDTGRRWSEWRRMFDFGPGLKSSRRRRRRKQSREAPQPYRDILLSSQERPPVPQHKERTAK